jgi:lipopolysaccharide export system permease protein
MKEFLGPFFVCLFGFMVIMVSGTLFELTDLIIVKKVSVNLVVKMMAYKLPGIMTQILPAVVLFATLLALSRLAKDSELTVMRMAGLRIGRITFPIIIIAAIISIMTFWMDDAVVPWTNHQFENMVRELVFDDPLPQIQEDVFFRTQNRTFYVRKIYRGSEKVEGVMIYELQPQGYPRILTAKEGLIKKGIWVLDKCVLREIDTDGYTRLESTVPRMVMRVDQNINGLFGEQKTTEEMTLKELRQNIELFSKAGASVTSFVVDYHLKMAMPFASLIFTLVGAPLSLKSAKGGRFFGIAASVVLTLLYYVASSVLSSLGRNGVLPPIFAAWVPNLLFALAGFGLIKKAD